MWNSEPRGVGLTCGAEVSPARPSWFWGEDGSHSCSGPLVQVSRVFPSEMLPGYQIPPTTQEGASVWALQMSPALLPLSSSTTGNVLPFQTRNFLREKKETSLCTFAMQSLI